MTTGAVVQRLAVAGAAFAMVAAGGCNSQLESERVGLRAPSLSSSAGEISDDAGVPSTSDAGPGEPDAASPPLADSGAGTNEPAVYLLSKFGEVDGTPVTFFDTASASDPSTLSEHDPAQAGFQTADSQLAVVHGNMVFMTDAVSPVVRRYDLDVRGRLVPGPSIDFASVGAPFVVGWQLSILSETKAYLFNEETERVVVWNPQMMELTGASLDFSGAAREGYNLGLAPRDARLRGNLLFVPAYWYEENEFFSMRTTAALVIDTTRDRIVQVAEDERCAAFSLVAHPSGDLYAFPDGFFAQEFYLDRPAPRRPLCALRIRAGQVGFDPSYSLDLGALVGGNEVSGGAVQGGFADGLGGIYLSVADEQRYLAGEEHIFRLWRWDVATGVAEALPDTPYWTSYMSSYTNAGEVFAQLPGVEKTTVLPLSHSPLVPFELTGWIEPFARLR
jgi:hypothetical protein